MASTSTAEPSTAMEETRNWLEMPNEIMGGMILHRLGAVQILNSAQKVCTTWRRICNDPAMWKVININHRFDACGADYDIVKLTKQAVDLSCGELIDINLEGFGTDELLDYISQRSSKLKSLRLKNSCTSFGLMYALKRLPHLETLHIDGLFTGRADHTKVIGQICPQLKSFKMKPFKVKTDGDYDAGANALAIGNSMPALCHLQLAGVTMHDYGLQAILHGCPHLESLDLHDCFYYDFDGYLVKRCRERIKDFKHPDDHLCLGPMTSAAEAKFRQEALLMTFI